MIFAASSARRSFMTAMCVALITPTGRAQVVGAGHPSLLVVHHDGQRNRSLRSHLPGLDQTNVTETVIELEPGDAFLLYTDGLFRWTNNERHQVTRQLENVLDHSAPTAEALLERIVAQTTPKNPGKPAPDDVAAIVVRRDDRQ